MEKIRKQTTNEDRFQNDLHSEVGVSVSQTLQNFDQDEVLYNPHELFYQN